MEQARQLLLRPGDLVRLPVVRGPLSTGRHCDGIVGAPGTAMLEWGKQSVKVVWSGNRQAGEQVFTPQVGGLGWGGGQVCEHGGMHGWLAKEGGR